MTSEWAHYIYIVNWSSSQSPLCFHSSPEQINQIPALERVFHVFMSPHPHRHKWKATQCLIKDNTFIKHNYMMSGLYSTEYIHNNTKSKTFVIGRENSYAYCSISTTKAWAPISSWWQQGIKCDKWHFRNCSFQVSQGNLIVWEQRENSKLHCFTVDWVKSTSVLLSHDYFTSVNYFQLAAMFFIVTVFNKESLKYKPALDSLQ